MGIFSQILKLTAISVFFSAAATIYVVDTDFYSSFLKRKNEPVVETATQTNTLSREEINKYRKHLRKTQLESEKVSQQAEKKEDKKSIWQNTYNN